MSNKEIALKSIYIFVFLAFCVDGFANENALRSIIAGVGLGATLRDLFVTIGKGCERG